MTVSLPALPVDEPLGIEVLQSAFRRLCTLMQIAEGAWALAVYESDELRQGLAARLQDEIRPILYVEISLLHRPPDLLALLQDLDISLDAPAPLVAFTAVGSGFPDLFIYLDLQREALARLPHRLLFWVNEYERRALAEHAPNFYSRLSGIFRLAGYEQPSVVSSSTRAGQPDRLPGNEPLLPRRRPYPSATAGQVRARLIEQFRSRIQTLRSVRQPDFKAVGDAWYDLAGLHETTDPPRWLEAEAAYCESARAYAAAGLRLYQAEAIYQAGDDARRAYNHTVALEHFQQALTLYRVHSDGPDRTPEAVLGEANVLKAQGDVLQFLKRTDEALTKYETALQLFQAVGDRLGEANVLKAQGDAILQSGDVEAGMALLEEARRLYVAVGDRVGLANVGIVLARYAVAQEDLAAAIQYLQPAADFCLEIGHPSGPQFQSLIDTWKTQLIEP